MNDTLKTILKEGILFGVAAAALFFVAPYVATAVGGALGIGGATIEILQASHPVIWGGAFFGTFGILGAGVRAASNYIFNDAPSTTVAAATHSAAKSPTREINIAQDIDIDAKSVSYVAKLKQERAAPQTLVRG